MTSTPERHFVIVLDANSARTKNYKRNRHLQELLEDAAESGSIKITVYLPFVVVEEWKKQYLTEAIGAVDALNRGNEKLNEMMNRSTDKIPSLADLEKAAHDYVTDFGINIHHPDYSKFNAEAHLLKALDNQPPFEEKSDKGYKDAIVALSMEQLAEKQQEGTTYFFVCNDGKLSQHLQEIIGTRDDIKLTDNIFEVRTALDLAHENLSIELVLPASKLFFSIEDNNHLFAKENIAEEIVKKYQERFPTVNSAQSKLESEGFSNAFSIIEALSMFGSRVPSGRIWKRSNTETQVHKTGFLKKEKRQLNWRTVVSVIQHYDLYSDIDGTQTFVGKVPHKMYFLVEWSTNLAVSEAKLISRPSYRNESALFLSTSSPFVGLNNLANMNRDIQKALSKLAAVPSPAFSGSLLEVSKASQKLTSSITAMSPALSKMREQSTSIASVLGEFQKTNFLGSLPSQPTIIDRNITEHDSPSDATSSNIPAVSSDDENDLPTSHTS